MMQAELEQTPTGAMARAAPGVPMAVARTRQSRSGHGDERLRMTIPIEEPEGTAKAITD